MCRFAAPLAFNFMAAVAMPETQSHASPVSQLAAPIDSWQQTKLQARQSAGLHSEPPFPCLPQRVEHLSAGPAADFKMLRQELPAVL